MTSSRHRSLGGTFTWAVAIVLCVYGIRIRTSSLPEQPPQAYPQIFCKQFPLASPAIPVQVQSQIDLLATKEITDPRGILWQATQKGLAEKDRTGTTRLWTGRDGLPMLSVRGVASGPDGRLWLSTEQGVICFQPEEQAHNRWFYFWGKRYLADNFVENIVAEPGRAWIRTRKGISLIEFKPYDLERKSELFVKRLQQRHNRYGLVAECRLRRASDPASFRLEPSDNDGLWTALYVAAECFRFAATRSPEALSNARNSLAALLRLESITGIPGFPARSFIRRGDYRDPKGEWHPTPGGEWEWKGDTSSDELVGHFFAYSVAYDLLPDEADRKAVRPVVARIAGHLLEHDLKLVGYGGRVTRWGNYSPEYFRTPEGKGEAPLSSLELLSHLRVAYHVTGEEKFRAAYHHIANQLGYAQKVTCFSGETPAEVNYSDEELAFLSFYPLMKLEDEHALRRQYQAGLEGLWRRAEKEQNPLWYFIYAAGTGAKNAASRDARDALERIPLDTISWTVKNSHRADLGASRGTRRDRFGEKQSLEVAIAPNERRVMKWNGNPFQLDGGDYGRSEDDGAFFLLPYWMGRYLDLLAP